MGKNIKRSGIPFTTGLIEDCSLFIESLENERFMEDPDVLKLLTTDEWIFISIGIGFFDKFNLNDKNLEWEKITQEY